MYPCKRPPPVALLPNTPNTMAFSPPSRHTVLRPSFPYNPSIRVKNKKNDIDSIRSAPTSDVCSSSHVSSLVTCSLSHAYTLYCCTFLSMCTQSLEHQPMSSTAHNVLLERVLKIQPARHVTYVPLGSIRTRSLTPHVSFAHQVGFRTKPEALAVTSFFKIATHRRPALPTRRRLANIVLPRICGVGKLFWQWCVSRCWLGRAWWVVVVTCVIKLV